MNAPVTVPIVSLRGVGKSFGPQRVLSDIDLTSARARSCR